jgi:hypothetical protein
MKMKTQKIWKKIAVGFIFLSAISILSVSIMSFIAPQLTMNLVSVKLNNTDAFSSIRGVYGGVGLTIFISLIYLLRNDIKKGLLFLSLLWGFYAMSRVMTIVVEGPLGDFGSQCLVIELFFFATAITLIFFGRTFQSSNHEAS